MNNQEDNENYRISRIYRSIQNTVHSQIQALHHATPRQRLALIHEVDSWLFQDLGNVQVLAITTEELELLLLKSRQEQVPSEEDEDPNEDIPF